MMWATGNAEERKSMLRDIEQEVVYTRAEIGKDALDPRVMAAIAKVPRERFVPEPYRFRAFANGPVPIGHGQTISQPYMVALMTDLVAPRPDSTILEVGTGSGYQAAVLAQVVARVFSVEVVPELAQAAERRLRDLGYANVAIRQADGWDGWPEHAPYDGVVVTAAAERVPPRLLDQLKPGARLVIPVGEPGGVQVLEVHEKRADGSVERRPVLMVAFVPLVHPAD
ncbi:MAG TPA: protein-L-isoaspartate(D-aspartate) O-methyltransferase [Rhodocyclaceae bacterium]